MNFQNTAIIPADLPDFEDLELVPISGKYGWVIAFNLLVFTVILFTGLFVFHFLQPLFFGIYFPYVVAVLIFLLLSNYVLTWFAFFTKKYGLRTHDVIYQSGLLKKTTVIIPFNRVQHVDLEEGWLSGLLEIKSVVIYTAGQRGGDIRINGLEKELSEKINQQVLNKINSEKPEITAPLITEISEHEV